MFLVGVGTNPDYTPDVDRHEQYRAHGAGSLATGRGRE
jgi:hypothetical protein